MSSLLSRMPAAAWRLANRAASRRPLGQNRAWRRQPKLAAQLAAMGKISEIIGKRSADVTGEVTVEVQNGNQQLRTPYAQRAVHHAQAGGEISRDEVPVALQDYVQQYFEELRKTARPVTSATPAAAPQHPGPSPGHTDSK
jgi:hypothetical protein